MPVFEIDLVRQLRSKVAGLLANCDERIARLEAEPLAPVPLMSVSNICIFSPEAGRLLEEAQAIGEWAEDHEETFDENGPPGLLDEANPGVVTIDGKAYTWAELKKAWDHSEAVRIRGEKLLKAEEEERRALTGMHVGFAAMLASTPGGRTADAADSIAEDDADR